MKKTTVLIADDHPVVRAGVRSILQGQPDLQVVGEAGDGEEALRLMAESSPDLLLLDLSMPKLPGLETLREMTSRSITTKTVLLTANLEKKNILEALQLGARGVVLKDAVLQDLVKCLRAIMEGKFWVDGKPVANLVQLIKDLVAAAAPVPRNTFGLTPRELEMVGLVVQGCANKDIASQSGITEETVKRHLKNIFDKLGVSSRLELAMYAIHHKLVLD
ncbi:MAG: response regulator transcription factor [Candidatus Acidiferrum sp.]